MSHRDEEGNAWLIPEPPGKCWLCGSVEETRPYGLNGEQICISCARKDRVTTERMMGRVLFGHAEEE